MRRSSCLIAVDGGIDHCLHNNLHPHLLVGDFDSVSFTSLSAFSAVPQVKLLRDKDKTDLEVAVEKAAEMTPGPLRIFGALGKRTDHYLFNLYLLARYPGRMTMESLKERVFVVRGQHKMACQQGQTISLLPIDGPVRGITTRGLKWELHEAAFDKSWMSISNVCLAREVIISAKEGDLLCCLQS